MATVIFRPAAELVLQEAHDWYEEREPGLGAEFIRTVDACVQGIRRHPEIFPAVYRQVRQGVLRRFPYSVLYVVAGDSVTVLSVFHSSRDPKIWKQRV